SKIRDEKKFGSLEEPRAAIADDQLKAKQILGLRI
ncbi:bifunctional riboflavin kinase/FAD synthetase, partial [Phocaeicola vulgatus]